MDSSPSVLSILSNYGRRSGPSPSPSSLSPPSPSLMGTRKTDQEFQISIATIWFIIIIASGHKQNWLQNVCKSMDITSSGIWSSQRVTRMLSSRSRPLIHRMDYVFIYAWRHWSHRYSFDRISQSLFKSARICPNMIQSCLNWINFDRIDRNLFEIDVGETNLTHSIESRQKFDIN
jgi:hypothetical protein